MNSIPTNPDDKNFMATYKIIVKSHNALVQVRFTVAGLYLAATGFLVNSWFSIDHQRFFYFIIPMLGIILAVSCWLLEIRTNQLLKNFLDRGYKIEGLMKVNPEIGFFELMTKQPRGPTIPFIDKEISPPKVSRKYIVSHSIGFSLLYSAILAFWVLAFLTSTFQIFIFHF